MVTSLAIIIFEGPGLGLGLGLGVRVRMLEVLRLCVMPSRVLSTRFWG